MGLIDRIRESINIRIWNNRPAALKILRLMSLLVSLMGLGAVVYYNGFECDAHDRYVCHLLVRLSIFFYFIKYWLRVFYDFHVGRYIRNTWIEGVVLTLFVLSYISTSIAGIDLIQVIGDYLHLEDFENIAILCIQVYFLIVMVLETARASQWIPQLKISPSGLLMLSFIIIVFAGAGLMMLPKMTIPEYHISFIDALFTVSGATFGTGAYSIDIPSVLTMQGKIVMIILIQIGGVNIIAFATFFATFSRSYTTGLRYQSWMKDFLNTQQVSDTRSILKDIIYFSLFFELIGTLCIFLYWHFAGIFDTFQQTLFYSASYAVAAFNNAGMVFWTEEFYQLHVHSAYFVQCVILALVFLGGIGFMALQDMFDPRSIRKRRAQKWRGLHPSTILALRVSAVLIIVATAANFFLEKDYSFAGYTQGERLFYSFFQAISVRTAGFGGVNIGAMCYPMMFITSILMVIGDSPSSTGGGLKTTTFYLLVKSAIANIRGKRQIEIGKHTVQPTTVARAHSIFVFYILAIAICSFLLILCEQNNGFALEDLVFETIGAFSTTGYSRGITFDLSIMGKSVVILTMFLGRVGMLTFMMGLSRKATNVNYRYGKTDIMIV